MMPTKMPTTHARRLLGVSASTVMMMSPSAAAEIRSPTTVLKPKSSALVRLLATVSTTTEMSTTTKMARSTRIRMRWLRASAAARRLRRPGDGGTDAFGASSAGRSLAVSVMPGRV